MLHTTLPAVSCLKIGMTVPRYLLPELQNRHGNNVLLAVSGQFLHASR